MHETPRRVRIVLFLLLVMIVLGVGATIYVLSSPEARQKLSSLMPKVARYNPGTYRVITFHDGDTITVDMDGTDETIRMIGVDTPETQDPRKNVQCYGKAASNFTRDLIGNDRVRLEADPTNSNRDRYNRLLRYVYTADNTLVNKAIIEQGYGFAYIDFPFSKRTQFIAAQNIAREENRGLWATCSISGTESRPQTNDAD